MDREVGGGRYAGRCELFENECRVDPAESAAVELLADIDAGKAERGRPPQRLYGELGLRVPAGGVR